MVRCFCGHYHSVFIAANVPHQGPLRTWLRLFHPDVLVFPHPYFPEPESAEMVRDLCCFGFAGGFNSSVLCAYKPAFAGLTSAGFLLPGKEDPENKLQAFPWTFSSRDRTVTGFSGVYEAHRSGDGPPRIAVWFYRLPHQFQGFVFPSGSSFATLLASCFRR